MRISDDDIKTIEVFSGISSSTIEDIKKSADIIYLKKNRALYSDRQVIDYVYFLLSGNISLIKSNENGESRVIFLFFKFIIFYVINKVSRQLQTSISSMDTSSSN